MQELFTKLTAAIEDTWYIAFSASFLWGIMSILLSPCHLSSIPLIVGFIDKEEKSSTGRAFWISTLFAVGILISIALIGFATAAAGRMMGDIGKYGNYFLSIILFAIGLHFLDVIPAAWSTPNNIGIKSKGPLAAFLLGLVFGIALGPCTFAYMAPMLATVFKLSSTDMFYGIGLLSAYGIGHCLIIIIAGTSIKAVQKYLNWNERSKGTAIIKKICGVLVIIGGLYLIYTTP